MRQAACINPKPNDLLLRKSKYIRTLIHGTQLLVLALLASPSTSPASVCLTCPQNATSAGFISGGFDVHVTRGGVDRTMGFGASVGACESLRLQALVQYAPFVTSGGVGSGFTGGTGSLFIIARGSQTGLREFLGDVTPLDMDTTLVTVTNPLVNPNLCIPPAGTTAVEAKAMLTNFYTLTAADIEAGSLQFEFDYTGTALLQDPITGECPNKPGGTAQTRIRIAPLPTCMMTPPLSLCMGSCEDITVTAVGQGPLSINLIGPGINITSNNLGTAGVLSTNIVTFPNLACAPEPGLTNFYAVTVRDFANCSANCTTSLTGTPLPTCTITAPAILCPGSPTIITVNAAGGSRPLNVSLIGPGLNISCNDCTSLSAVVPAPASNVTNAYTGRVTDLFNCAAANVTSVSGSAPAVILSPATNSVCAGSLAGFTASVDPNTNGPYIFSWTGPTGFTSGPRTNSIGNDSISLENAQAANAGVYVGTVQDAFGCTVMFSGTLIVRSEIAGITATVACSSDAVQPGQTINLTGMVTNTGGVTLTEVNLFDSLSGGQVAHFDSLAPGAAQFYQNNYLATAGNCGNTLTETLIAVGLDACGNSISNTASCSFQVRCPPRISSVALAGSDLILSGSGGMTNGVYAVLTATDVSAPMAAWILLGTNHFDANGQFTLTNHINLNEGKRYFRLLLQ